MGEVSPLYPRESLRSRGTVCVGATHGTRPSLAARPAIPLSLSPYVCEVLCVTMVCEPPGVCGHLLCLVSLWREKTTPSIVCLCLWICVVCGAREGTKERREIRRNRCAECSPGLPLRRPGGNVARETAGERFVLSLKNMRVRYARRESEERRVAVECPSKLVV